ncbi:hypothetical protein F5J12DRAFT_905733 [Pisolithus orientalis]|uniref:uncharacterized protein n=1 Tax=Pisolithus orientalis TaxID=936130 RepID=UPI00222581CC|nr:uncharacterized protein F5J12DRAFT_905733 [Pisolithus orientalis]KAI6006232.1 hypothetical protein F5J12DRAFT_905733 [Pisolithus orientalis]
MTLNTFHYASVSSKNATLSVPCLKEIINIATNIKMLSAFCIKDFMFIKSFFTIPDKEIESKLHLQSPWHLWLVLNHARKIDWSLAVVTGHITGSFKMDLFIGTVEEDIFLCQFKNTTLNLVSLRSVPTSYFCWSMMRGASRREEQVLETDSVNLKAVICLPDVNFTQTYLNSQTPMEIAPHGINHTDIGTLASLIGGETVGILMEAAGCH